MCGIAGQFNIGLDTSEASILHDCKKMADAIVHRGPDDYGIWIDQNVGIGLAHRRLAILDLTPAGHQPMTSVSGRYVIVFNGEIYNHLDLRKEIDSLGVGQSWRGHSDTETLLAAIDTWGLDATLKRCVGMFAIALWDREARALFLARDRLGEKPLYYGWQKHSSESVFLFGSELKALRAHHAFRAEVDRNSLALYLRHNYIPAPHSIYKCVHKLMPGTILKISLDRHEPEIWSYWSALEVIVNNETSRGRSIDPLVAVNELEALLKSAISQQMMADVPLGAFLSGGVDSSAIVALMQSQSNKPIKTFTIGFHEAGYDEAEHAKAVAKHLGTDHTELYITSQEAMSIIPRLPLIYDEPFSDSSQIPTLLVSEMARRHVTVSLSGDAGDELFSGYTRYTAASAAWRKLSYIPRPIRKVAARSITSISPGSWSKLASAISSSQFGSRFGDKLHKGAGVLASASIDGLYHGLVSHWSDPSAVVIGAKEPLTLLTSNVEELRDLTPTERMMGLDLLMYLPDDILTKVDRASMAVSLESRIPMLDHRVVEFAWGLPQSLKQRDGVGKWILRQVLYKHVPQELIDRPKMGFGVPIDAWLRGPLRNWAEALLAEDRLRAEGYFHAGPIRQKWAEHLAGSRNWAYHLWDILMFQAWLETQS